LIDTFNQYSTTSIKQINLMSTKLPCIFWHFGFCNKNQNRNLFCYKNQIIILFTTTAKQNNAICKRVFCNIKNIRRNPYLTTILSRFSLIYSPKVQRVFSKNSVLCCIRVTLLHSNCLPLKKQKTNG